MSRYESFSIGRGDSFNDKRNINFSDDFNQNGIETEEKQNENKNDQTKYFEISDESNQDSRSK